MVTMVQLRDAKWSRWDEAAKGWRTFADQASYAGMDIRDQGVNQLEENWPDRVGQAAGRVLKGLSDEFDCAHHVMDAVSNILEGLAEAVEVAQRELQGALALADRHHLRVNEDGTAEPWDHPDSQGDNGYYEAMEWRPRVMGMIRDAVEAATQADTLAAQKFARLAEAATLTDPVEAINVLHLDSGNAQLEMIRSSIPHGQPREVVEAWWNSLSDAQRRELELAVPVDIAGLDGIPEEVKNRLRGPGPLNRVELVRFALEHWNDKAIDDRYGFPNNCTNFVSTSLSAAGMPENSDWTSSTMWDFPPGSPTNSWGGARNLHDYLVEETNSREISRNDARPGDVIFVRQRGVGHEYGGEPGTIWHSAVVTSVLPDGDVLYTQHTNSMKNGSLDGRLPHIEEGHGDVDVIVVRVDPTER